MNSTILMVNYSFAMVMDTLTDEVRQESPQTIIFADDIVMCESREHVEENLERWMYWKEEEWRLAV